MSITVLVFLYSKKVTTDLFKRSVKVMVYEVHCLNSLRMVVDKCKESKRGL